MSTTAIKTKLSAMMFLQFFIWGLWAVTLGTYLGKTLSFAGSEIGLIYGTTAIGAIVAPLIVSFIADRYFSSQYLFSVLHLLGACLLFSASYIHDFSGLYFCMLAYALCYMPTLALANSISFFHLAKPDNEFPKIRVLGTIGWIVAGITVGSLNIESQSLPLKFAAAASLTLSLFAIFLPKTPPQKSAKKATLVEALGLNAFSLLRFKPFLVLFICSIFICIPLAFYYNFTNLFLNDIGMDNAASKMTLGQVSEVLFMLLMPLLFRHLGIKWMLVIGMLAWVVRYGLFSAASIGNETIWMLYIGIILHGICYDFFFVSGQVYADKIASKSLRNSVQGMMTLATYGVGMFIGSFVSGQMVSYFTHDGIRDWQSIWLFPCLFALTVTFIFAISFKDKQATES